MRIPKHSVIHSLGLDEISYSYCYNKNSVLYPDQAVFLGPKILCANNIDELNNIKNNSDFTVSTVNYSYEIPYGIIDRKLDKLHRMIEKPTYNYDINAGIYVLNTKILKFIKKNKYADIDHLINLLVKKKLKSFIFPIYEHWFEIGRKKHLKNLPEKFSYE